MQCDVQISQHTRSITAIIVVDACAAGASDKSFGARLIYVDVEQRSCANSQGRSFAVLFRRFVCCFYCHSMCIECVIVRVVCSSGLALRRALVSLRRQVKLLLIADLLL